MDHVKPFQKLVPSSSSHQRHFFFKLPIAQRLTLGFLTAALIATAVTSVIGIQQAQALHKQSVFYQKLLQTDTMLTAGSNDLELMNSLVHTTLGLAVPAAIDSHETLKDNESALHNLIQRYDTILYAVGAQDLLTQYPEQTALLDSAGYGLQVQQQRVLQDSASREWKGYRNSLLQFITDIARGDYNAAQLLIRTQEEPLNADAISALRSLDQHEKSLTGPAAYQVSAAEQYQLIVTITGALFTGLSIALVGLLISNTVVNRLKQLRRIAQAVEEGKTSERIKVSGRDEIADISKAVNSMLEIIAEEEEITAAYQLREQFIASVSHELRNPLTEVVGWLETLRDHHAHMDVITQIRFINNATYGCLDIMHLINNVLDAAQTEHQMKAPILEEIPIAQVVQAVLEHLDPREKSASNIHMEIAQSLIAWADEQYVRQVLRNLLSNALKYAPRHTPILISAIQEEPAEGRESMQNGSDAPIRICVQDAGPGIPPEEIADLFQKFKRLKRDTSGTTHGTGLGLYISRQLVEAMHGKIWVESSGIQGKGSSFYFTLPTAHIKPLASNKLVCSSSIF